MKASWKRHGEWLETLGSGSREQEGSLPLVAMKREEPACSTRRLNACSAPPGLAKPGRPRFGRAAAQGGSGTGDV